MAEESVPTNPGLPYSFPPFKAVPIYRYTFVIQVMLVVVLLHLSKPKYKSVHVKVL